jgi:hypothetical protein
VTVLELSRHTDNLEELVLEDHPPWDADSGHPPGVFMVAGVRKPGIRAWASDVAQTLRLDLAPGGGTKCQQADSNGVSPVTDGALKLARS